MTRPDRPDLDALSADWQFTHGLAPEDAREDIHTLIAYARELEGRIEKALTYIDQWDEKRMSPNIANLRAALAVSAGEEEQ